MHTSNIKKHYKRIFINSIFFFVLFLILVNNLNGLDIPLASTSKPPILRPEELRIVKDKMTVNVNNIPIYIVLNEISKRGGIWFKGDKDLLMRKVSVRFKDLPMVEGIKKIINPLSYIMIINSENTLEGLYILKSDQDPTLKNPVSEKFIKDVTNNLDNPNVEVNGHNPPLDYEMQATPQELPPFTVYSNDTGPPVDPDKTSLELPDFIPFENNTGPPLDPKGKYKELPEFVPSKNDFTPLMESNNVSNHTL